MGRSLDHQVLPVHLAPRRRDEMNIITNSFNPSKYITVNIYIYIYIYTQQDFLGFF